MTAWLWAFYFGLKLALHAAGVVRVHFWPNLLLLALAMPFSPLPGREPRRLARLRQAAAVALGAALLWYDSYLPPFWYVARFAAENGAALSPSFLRGFAKGFAAGAPLLAAAAALLAACLYAARRGLHPTPAVFLALLLVPVHDLREPGGEIAARVARFYRTEASRRVAFPAVLKGAPFDIVLLHVCSLSWDDLDAAGIRAPSLFRGAGVVFTDFNSATSYSTPAGLRLMRAPCGQVPHARLYEPWPRDCGLAEDLRDRGYRVYTALNYDRSSFGMYADMSRYAGAAPPVPTDGVPVRLINFDGEKILDDAGVLDRWWAERVRSGAPRAFLYYNTVSLHGGAHEDKPGWWKESEPLLYARTLDRMERDLETLLSRLEGSGRSAVVLVVPEHGRAIRGSRVQAKDLRDIPLERITRVPVAVRFVGPLFAGAPRGLRSSRPFSYLALARLLSDLLADPSLAAAPGGLEREVDGLPETEFLSETDHWKVFRAGGEDFLYGKDGAWRRLSEAAKVAGAEDVL